ncbi:hypothetical protein MUP46_00510 [Patescibacteria group bacterium]|nr:hypothetical protein [Patescibacteria group bacterium]
MRRGHHFALSFLDTSNKKLAAFLAPLEAASAPVLSKTSKTPNLALFLSLSIRTKYHEEIEKSKPERDMGVEPILTLS